MELRDTDSQEWSLVCVGRHGYLNRVIDGFPTARAANDAGKRLGEGQSFYLLSAEIILTQLDPIPAAMPESRQQCWRTIIAEWRRRFPQERR